MPELDHARPRPARPADRDTATPCLTAQTAVDGGAATVLPPRGASRAPRLVARAVAAGVLALALLAAGLVPSFGASASAASLPSAVSRIQLPADFKTLYYGQRSERIRWVQSVLHVAPRTGYFGPITRGSVRAFQDRKNLRVTGAVDGSTMRWLIWTARQAAASAPSRSSAGARIVATAMAAAKGARYEYGATGPREFDCSGFVGYVVRRATGKQLPRASYAIRASLPRIAASQLRPGDLVFVHNGSGGRVGHVAVYAGGGYWWEASNARTGVGLHKAWSTKVSYGRA